MLRHQTLVKSAGLAWLARLAKLLVMLCLATLPLISLASLAQTTSVTFQVIDTDPQTWNTGTWVASLYSPPGVPSGPANQYVISGTSTVVPNQQQSGSMDGSGNGSLTVTPNGSIAPSGTQWQFTFCPSATPAQCYTQAYSINGTSQVLTVTPPAIRISVASPMTRAVAYTDTEVTGASLGSLYYNTVQQAYRVCGIITLGVCQWQTYGVSNAGYQDTTQLSGADAGIRIQNCLNLASKFVCDATAEPTPITMSVTLTQCSATGQIVILPVGTINMPNGVTWNICGNHNMLQCNQWRACTLNGSNNGGGGTVTIQNGIDDHIIGVTIIGGSSTNQGGSEVNMTGGFHSFEHGQILQAGSFGMVQVDCYRCKTIDSFFRQSVKAAWNTNTNLLATSSVSSVGTVATVVTSATSILGPVGNYLPVLISGCSVSAYNGSFWGLETATNTFTYNGSASFGSTPTGCQYTVPSLDNQLLDSQGVDNNTINTGDAQVGITSSGVLNGTSGTIIRGNKFSDTLPACSGDTTNAVQQAITSISTPSGGSAIVTVSANPNLILSPTASTILFTGGSFAGSTGDWNSTAGHQISATGGTYTFTVPTTATGANTAVGTFVVFGHGANATGCSEMYQMTDKAVNTEFDSNTSINSYKEAFAMSNSGNHVHHNRCFNPSLSGGAGIGCYMLSITHNGGLEGGYVGDSVFDHNLASNSGSNTSAYAFSLQAGSNATATTFQNVIFDDNVVDGTNSTFGCSFRWNEGASTGNMTLTNIVAHDNSVVGATSAYSGSCFSAGTTTIGGVRQWNNSTTGPSCAITSGGGTSPSCITMPGSTDNFGIIRIHTGTSVASSSIIAVITFAAPFVSPTSSTNLPGCQYTLNNGVQSWANGAIAQDNGDNTTNSAVAVYNGSTIGSSVYYYINYVCTTTS